MISRKHFFNVKFVAAKRAPESSSYRKDSRAEQRSLPNPKHCDGASRDSYQGRFVSVPQSIKPFVTARQQNHCDAMGSTEIIPMEEHRTTQRQRQFKARTISSNRAAGISCTIRNISTSGACLEVASPVGIPPVFDLFIEPEHCLPRGLAICKSHWRCLLLAARFVFACGQGRQY
jgi:hypothetical protein